MDDPRGGVRIGPFNQARLPPVETVRSLGSEHNTARRYDDAIHVAHDSQQVKSKEEAVAWASRCPASDNEIIEVRQVQEFSDFPADVQEAAARFPELQAQSGQRKGS
jgi:hypothetical protein